MPQSACSLMRFGARRKLARNRPADLSDGDPVECGVHLSVPASVEAEALLVAAPHRDGRRSVPPGEGCRRVEAVGPGRLAPMILPAVSAPSSAGHRDLR